MVKAAILNLFLRDLEKLMEEITLYDESKLWLTPGKVSNSAGNLCLHLCGNLKHFIGAILGDTGYVRDREAEFSDKNIAIKALLENIEETKVVVQTTLNQMSPERLEEDYPMKYQGNTISIVQFLIHLEAHLNYHRGQINYHRRLI